MCPPPWRGCQAIVAALLRDAQLTRLEGFHVKCARRLTGMRPSKCGYNWVCPKSADVLCVARLQLLRYYIQKRRATVAKAIAIWPILEECRGVVRLCGTPVRNTSWEQDLTQPPEPERGGDGTPGLGAYIGAPGDPGKGGCSHPATLTTNRTRRLLR